MPQSPVEYNIGFAGRTFLTEWEWRTYLRRQPVPYTSKALAATCDVCGGTETAGHKFQRVHKVGYHIGIVLLALTPDFLDDDRQIVTAHKRHCHKAAELSLQASMQLLRDSGIRELPTFLPHEIHALWNEVTGRDHPGQSPSGASCSTPERDVGVPPP